ncbi:MAG: carbohydrate binding domain-containing protein [Muribaculaceae bacterium]|nr:carbohydrate binding domain-containing protein [Muribaculaceae bacterium]
MNLKPLLSSLAIGAAVISSMAATNDLKVNVGKPGAPIQPTMYGIFFEDINYAADGGLYAELVKNRSFEFPQAFMGWDTFGKVELKDDGPFERNPHYVRLSPAGHREKHTGLANEGYFGIGVEKDATYRFSVWARTTQPGDTARLRVELINPSDMGESQVIGRENLKVIGNDWKKYTVVVKADKTCDKAKLRVFLRKPEVTVDLEHLSLFPTDTWMGHENGMRADLAQLLKDVHPGVFRFPGGCIVEGTDPDTRYQWKETVGPVENRPTNENRWHYTFAHRFFPDYFQNYGLGFYEYFQLAEEIGAEPLPILNVGLVCQYQNDLDHQIPTDSLDIFIQDALDLIEFANGSTDTKWGALRAEMGHPEPFNLKFLGIGNEQWGPEYPERLEPFVKVLRKAHPEIKIVGSSGPDSEGAQFEYLWPEMTRLGADLVDEHFYRKEDWFLSQGKRYDNYDRKGPKVFAGEYACHGKGKKYNHYNAALLEAAFMTGLERNADVVHMATYAPLFAHIDGWQWRPDMIWFDNLRSMPTCSYYVQQLYATNKGTNVLPLTMNGEPVAGQEGQNGLFASAVLDADDNTIIVKVANTSAEPQQLNIDFAGLKKKETISGGKVITFTSTDPMAENTLDEPYRMAPTEAQIEALGANYTTVIEPKTFKVYRFNRSNK